MGFPFGLSWCLCLDLSGRQGRLRSGWTLGRGGEVCVWGWGGDRLEVPDTSRGAGFFRWSRGGELETDKG